MKAGGVASIAAVVLLLGTGVGVGLKLAGRSDQPKSTQSLPVPKVDELLPHFAYTDLSGQVRHSSEWKSKILVLNFWAPWCPPCQAETPGFVKLQQQFRKDNVQFVGIALDDRHTVDNFVKAFAIDYPVLLGNSSALKLSSRLGNRLDGLPFTIVATPSGRIILHHTGALSETYLGQVLQDAVQHAKHGHLISSNR